MRLLFLLLVTALCVPAFGQTRFEYKGVGIGDNEQTAVASGLVCRAERENFLLGQTSCTPPDSTKSTVAGATVSYLAVRLVESKVGSIYVSFHSRDFEQVLAAVTEKYGAPASIEEPPLQTRAGVNYTNKIATWRAAGEELVLKRYAGAIDSANMSITSDDYRQAIELRRKAAAKKNSGDL